MISGRLNRPNGRGSFMVFNGCDEDYAEQLCSEEKVPAKNGNFVWQPKTAHIDNHFLDCEVYAALAADLLNVRYLEDLNITQEYVPAQKPKETSDSFIHNSDSWIHTQNNWLRK